MSATKAERAKASASKTTKKSAKKKRTTERTGSNVLVQGLLRHGVDTIFAYTGAALIPFLDALYDEDGINVVVPRHEQGGAHAADGYARATGRPGVVVATSGPGATNLVTGIATAYLDSIPMIAITGQVKRALIGNDAFQEIDTTGVTRPLTKHSVLVTDPEDLPRIIDEAFHIATTGRPGPVLIDLPVDITTSIITAPWPKAVSLPGYEPPTHGNEKQIAKAAEAINAAEQPVLYVGGGAIHADCAAEILSLAERASIPVTTTMMGLGAFPEEHPLALKMLGMHGTAYANYAVMASDLLIAVGARFDDRVTGNLEEFAPHATIIHIDIDPTSVGKNVSVDIPIVGPADSVLADLLPQIKKQPRKAWREQISTWKHEAPLAYRTDEGLRPQAIIETLGEFTRRRESIICTDVGQHQMWSALFHGFRTPRSWISSGGLGTMGFGLPAAIGAQLGRPKAQVVCITGDGSFQMNIQEMATLQRLNLPVKIILLNNSYLGMVRQWQELFFDHRYAQTDLSDNPDFVKLSEAFGIPAIRLTDPAKTRDALAEFLAHDGPMLLDAIIEREENVYPMVPAGEAIDRMIGGMA